MSDTVNIPKNKLECLRRHLSEAIQILDGLGVEVREPKAPKLSPKKERVQKYLDKLK